MRHPTVTHAPRKDTTHSYHYEAFGSWDTTIRYRGRVFRAVFDGRDRAYCLEESTAAKPPYAWKGICSIDVPGDDPWKEIVQALVRAAG